MSVEADIPGFGQLRLEHLVLDVNGTLAVEGALIEGVAERLRELTGRLTVHLLSGDTYGRTGEVAESLGLRATIIRGPDEAGAKRARVEELGRPQLRPSATARTTPGCWRRPPSGSW